MKNMPNTTLVFLPGWGFKSSIWENITIFFKHHFKHHSVLLLDLPIIPSTHSSPSSQLNYIINQLYAQIPKQSTIVAWSFSGLIAMCLCHQHPHRYRQLIITNSTPKFSSDILWPGISNTIQKRFMDTIHNDFDHLIKKFIQLIQYPLIDTCYQDFLPHHFLSSSGTAPLYLIEYLHLLFSIDCRQFYSQLTLPITYILGGHDAIIPIEIVEPLKQLNSRANIHIIRKAGHAPFLSHPSIFSQYIRDII